MRANHYSFILGPLVLGFIFYFLATTTFTPTQLAHFRFDPVVVTALGSIGGLAAILIGYGSVVNLGGASSLKVANFMAHLTRSKKLIEFSEKKPTMLRHKLLQEAHLAYLPALLFLLSVGLSWDIYNADAPRAGIFRPVLHALNIFSKPVRVNPVLYSVELIPVLIVILAIAGAAPSIAFPYLRYFKVTGINSGPFHTTLVIAVTGLVAGLSVLFTLVGFVYRVLWMNNAPLYYHYALLVMVGLSMHYAVGTSLGLDRAKRMIKERMKNRRSNDRIECILP